MLIDGVNRITLNNGLTILTREVQSAPVVSFWIWYRVGSRNERPGLTGISHWVEHMLFKGTPSYPHGDFDRQVQREGGTFNGMTWLDWTAYYETLPSDRIDLALRIEADRMVNSLFDPQETESERTVIISEREGRENQPTFLLTEQVQALSFLSHPYHHRVIGWKEDLRTITRDDLYRHYRQYYVPNNAVIVAVGDFETDKMVGDIAKRFGPIAKGGEQEQHCRPKSGYRTLGAEGRSQPPPPIDAVVDVCPKYKTYTNEPMTAAKNTILSRKSFQETSASGV